MKLVRSISIQKEWSATNNKGFSLVEALLGVAVFGLLITGIIGAFVYGRESTVIAGNRTRAIFLAEEGIEAMVNMRDQNFGLLHKKTGGLMIADHQWVLAGTEDTTGIFTRIIEVGALDNLTRIVTSTVTWRQNAQRDGVVTLVRRFSNWLIKSMSKTTLADFESGFKNSTEAIDLSGGDIDTTATGDWTAFINTIEYDSDGTGDINDLDVHFASQVMVTVANVTVGDEFNVLDISDITSENITKLGGLDYAFNLKDVDVYDNYAYVATEDANELLVIRLTDFVEVNTYDLPSDANAESVKVVDGVVYLGTLSSASEEFYALDVSDPEGTITELGKLELAGDIYSIDVVDGYAYLATSVNTAELTVIRLSDYTNVNSYSTASNDMYDIVVEDDKAYLAGIQSGAAEVYIVEVSSPEGILSTLGSMEVAGNANGIDVNDDGTIFVVSSDDSGEIYSFDGVTYEELNSYDMAGADNVLGVNAYGGHAYVVGTADTLEVAVYQSGITIEEMIYIDAMVSPWTLSTNSASANESEDIVFNTINTGSSSLSVNFVDVNGYARFNHTIDLTNYVTLEFYLNSISPWAFAAWNNTAPHAGLDTTYSNPTYGTDFERNLSIFTDFPVPDMAAFKTVAQGTSSYLNPAGDLTLDDDSGGEISAYNGKLVYVEFQTPGDLLTLDFGDNSGPFTVSFVTNGAIELVNYRGTTFNTSNNAYPVLLAENDNITFNDNQNLPMTGFIYSGGEVDSSAHKGKIITLNGMVMANLLDNSFEYFNITYNIDRHANPPINFSPDYFGQNFDMSLDTGNTQALTDYLPAGIDNDMDTWEIVEVAIADFNATNGTTTYIQFGAPDTQGTNHTTWFIDDVRMEGDSDTKVYRALGAYTSVAIDSTDPVTTWSDIAWQSSATSTTNYLEFQIRTAIDDAGSPGIWTKWSGPTSGEDFFTDFTGETQLTNTIHRDGVDDQWLQYRAFFYGVSTSSPILESVSIRYNN